MEPNLNDEPMDALVEKSRMDAVVLAATIVCEHCGQGVVMVPAVGGRIGLEHRHEPGCVDAAPLDD